MSLKHLVIGGKNISYSDIGAGAETVILIHCSGASHRIFDSLSSTLTEHYRVLAPDLAGYGASESWPANESFSYTFDVKIIKRLIDLANGPVHLVGYSYGGLLALEGALITPQLRSLTLLEPVALHLLREADDARLLTDVNTMGAKLLRFAKAGKLKHAAKTYINYWGGALSWMLLPGRVKNTIQHSAAKTAMEFSSGMASVHGLGHYQGITCPVLLIGGEKSKEAAKTVINLLEKSLANPRAVLLGGVAHLTLLRHKTINNLIFQWLKTGLIPPSP